MFNAKALLFSIFGGDEMYVPKPGVGPFNKNLVRLGGKPGDLLRKITLSEDFYLNKAFDPTVSTSGRGAITITYPTGGSFWLDGPGEDYAEELGILLPKGTVISHPQNVGVTGYYVVPASSVGGG